MIIDYIGISDEAKKIKSYFKSLHRPMTPEKVCALHNRDINIDIELIPIETNLPLKEYKANYTYIKRQHIVLYSKKIKKNLEPILYHEIGHRVLHWRDSDYIFHIDSDSNRLETQYELEAEVFAAEMCLDDDIVLSCLFSRRLTFFQTARVCGVPNDTLYFKCRILQERGFTINLPITVTSDCLKGRDC